MAEYFCMECGFNTDNAEELAVDGMPDFVGDTEGCTMYYVCPECGNLVEVLEDD